MARPRKADRKVPTDALVLVAAAETFGAVGYEAARLEDIATRAGITRASLLYHFASKEALYQAVLARAFAAMQQALEEALGAGGTFEQQLSRIVSALTTFGELHLPLLSVVLRGSLRDDDPIARHEFERSLLPVVDRIELVVRKGAGLPRSFPVRAAILQLIFGHLVHAVMGPLGAALWKGEAHTQKLARQLFGLNPSNKEMP